MLETIRNYVFDAKGEFIRGLEVTVITEGAQILRNLDVEKVTDWKAWAISAGTAIGVAVVAYVKGKLPPKPSGEKVEASVEPDHVIGGPA